MLGILQGVIWWYSHKHGLLAASVDHGIYRYQLAGTLVTPVVFLATIPIAVFIDPAVAIWSWLSLDRDRAAGRPDHAASRRPG